MTSGKAVGFGRVAIIGTGLIGGSVALGLTEAGAAETVVGYDLDREALAAGAARGAIASVAGSVGEAVTGADLIVLAAPVSEMASLCEGVAQRADPEAIVTDVGSAKARAVYEGERTLGRRFVGGHPMAGSERHGIGAADPALFHDAWWILTPTPMTSSAAYRRASALASTLGARPVALAPEDHDRLLARLSHLPQVISSTLVASTVQEEDNPTLLGLAAGGFRDVTRIAASEPELWVSILRANREAVLEALEGFTGELAGVAEWLRAEDWASLATFLGAARSARVELFTKSTLQGVPVLLTMPVLDRPGVLAEVTTAAGSLGANIEDLRIVHSTEGGRGMLELVVVGEDAAEQLARVLRDSGYHVEFGRPTG